MADAVFVVFVHGNLVVHLVKLFHIGGLFVILVWLSVLVGAFLAVSVAPGG